jgi:FlaG/FlaF family flagellin (archaellin)
MKSLRRFSVACAFTLALTIPAFADGQIDTTVAPPPPQSQTQAATTTDGDIQTPLTGQAGTSGGEVSATGSATDAALNLVQSVLALL